MRTVFGMVCALGLVGCGGPTDTEDPSSSGSAGDGAAVADTSETSPSEISVTDAETLVADSDDVDQHRAAFAAAAQRLIVDGDCTKDHFVEMGGWVRSSNHPDGGVYFTYCGGMEPANRVYLDVRTGQTFR